MNNVGYFSRYENIIDTLSTQGAFLTVKDRSARLNTMTIGWALLGIMWRKPIFMIAVRSNRHTFKLLEDADDFTVTIPFADVKEQLIFCGTNSGAVIDKFQKGGLVTIPAVQVNTPIIEFKNSCCYECKIVQISAMDKTRLSAKYDQEIYQDRSYHTYYFGEIVACYEI